MNLVKTSAYSALSQATTVIVGLLSVKIVASEIGPEGLALQGQFLNSTAILAIFGSGAIGAGVIKYLSEYSDNRELQLRVIRSAITITLGCSALMALFTIAMAGWFSVHALKNSGFQSVYWIYGLFLPLICFNFLFAYVLNGLKKIPALTAANIFTSIVNLVLIVCLATNYGVYGVLITSSMVSIFVFALHIYFFLRFKWFPLKELKPRWDKEIFLKLFRFSSMSMLAGFGMPFVQILIRDKLIKTSGLVEAGYWQTVSRISDFYLSFLVAVLSVYFLPKLSGLKKDEEIRSELFQTGKYIFPFIIIMTTGIWLGRDLIIKYLLTKEFEPARNLFHFQLMGDIFKVGGWMLSNILWAKAMTKKYLLIDGTTMLFYALISSLCIDQYGVIGATMGFFITYVLYFIVMAAVNRKYLFLTGRNAR